MPKSETGSWIEGHKVRVARRHGPVACCHGPLACCHGPLACCHGPLARCHGRLARGRSRGFTLIELLIVVMIVGLTAGLAVLSLGGLGERQWAVEASRFVELARFVQDESLLLGQARAIGFAREGRYAFLEQVYLDRETVVWEPIDRSPLAERSLARLGAEFRLTVAGRALVLDNTTDLALVEFDPAGGLTPFVLEWRNRDGALRIRIIGQAGGALDWESPR